MVGESGSSLTEGVSSELISYRLLEALTKDVCFLFLLPFLMGLYSTAISHILAFASMIIDALRAAIFLISSL